MEQLLNIGSKGSGNAPQGANRPPFGLEGLGGADMGKLFGEDLSGVDMKQLAQQADAMWKFLDDLAETDEDAYKKFMAKQAEAAAAATKQQQSTGKGEEASGTRALVSGSAPAMVVEALVTGGRLPAGSVAVVQLWPAKEGSTLGPGTVGQGTPINSDTSSWVGLQVPLAQFRDPQQHQQQVPTPATAAPPRSVCTYSLAVHPKTLALALEDRPKQLRLVLAAAAYQFVETKHGIFLNRSSWRLRVNSALVPEAERTKLQADWQASAASRAAQGTAVEGVSQSLLQQLSGLGLGGVTASRPDGPTGVPTHLQTAARSPKAAVGAGGASKAPLIVDLGPPPGAADAKALADGADAASEACGGGDVPVSISPAATSCIGSVQVSVEDADDGRGCVVLLQAHLPLASKASDVDMEVVRPEGTVHSQPGRVVLRVQGVGELSAELPAVVDDRQAKAKFDSKRKVLTVRFPVVAS